MSNEAIRELQAQIHEGALRLLLQRIKDGSATASDLSVARALLKDSGITAQPVKGSPLQNLAESIPTFDDDGSTTSATH